MRNAYTHSHSTKSPSYPSSPRPRSTHISHLTSLPVFASRGGWGNSGFCCSPAPENLLRLGRLGKVDSAPHSVSTAQREGHSATTRRHVLSVRVCSFACSIQPRLISGYLLACLPACLDTLIQSPYGSMRRYRNSHDILCAAENHSNRRR